MQDTDRQTYSERANRARKLASIEKDSTNERALLGLADSYEALVKQLDLASGRVQVR